MTDTYDRHAADYVAAMTDTELGAFLVAARKPATAQPVTETDLARMTPKEINDARRAGRLDDLLRRPTHKGA